MTNISDRITLKLRREEALVCIIALESKPRLFEWQKDALKTLLDAMGLKPHK